MNGSFNTSAYDGRYLTFKWWVISQNIVGNYTDIGWSLVGAGGTTTRWYESSKFKIIIEGEQVYYSSAIIRLYNGTTVASGTKRIYHNGDGTKTFGAYAEAGIYTYNSVNVSGWNSFISLPTIPRASTPTISGSLQLGETITINTNRASTAFTHTLKYVWGSMSGTIATNITTNTTWIIPKDLANGIPNGINGTLRVYCDTYNGSNLIGTKYTDVSVTVPNTAEFQPKINDFTLVETIEGLKEKFGSFVQLQSKAKGTVSATSVYSATIKKYSISINGVIYSDKEFTTDYLLYDGIQDCDVTVTDSRGRTTTKKFNYNVLKYALPTIDTFTVDRCDEDGTINDEASNVIATIDASISPVNNKNTKSFKILYKKQKDSQWTTVTLSNTNFTFNGTKIILNIDDDYEYDFKLEVTDYFTTIPKSFEIPTGFTLMNVNLNGRAIGFGKVSAKQDAIEINMPIFDKFDTQIRNGLAAYVDGGEDADTTLDEIALCGKNTPLGSSSLFYVRTMFHSDKKITSNRTQVAYPYTTGVMYIRQYVNGTWSEWAKYARESEVIWSGNVSIPNWNAGTSGGTPITLKKSINNFSRIMFVRAYADTAIYDNSNKNITKDTQIGLSSSMASNSGGEGFNVFLMRVIFLSDTTLKFVMNAYSGINTDAGSRFAKDYSSNPLVKIIGIY